MGKRLGAKCNSKYTKTGCRQAWGYAWVNPHLFAKKVLGLHIGSRSQLISYPIAAKMLCPKRLVPLLESKEPMDTKAYHSQNALLFQKFHLDMGLHMITPVIWLFLGMVGKTPKPFFCVPVLHKSMSPRHYEHMGAHLGTGA